MRSRVASASVPSPAALLLAAAALAGGAACGGSGAPPAAAPAEPAVGVAAPAQPTAAAAAAGGKSAFKGDREAFNRAAALENEPLFWVADANGDRALDPAELAVYWGLRPGATRADYVAGGRFTPRGEKALAAVFAHANRLEHEDGCQGQDCARKLVVERELEQGRVTLVATDLEGRPDAERKMAAHVMAAAAVAERLYQKQMGTYGLDANVPASDPASRTLFWRNQGPRCEAPLTQASPDCGAYAGAAKQKPTGLYPRDLAAKEGFCKDLGKHADAKALLDPFTVVVDGDKGPKAVPYHLYEPWKADLAELSRHLNDAEKALGQAEPGLRAYLAAAAKAAVDGSWFDADEAWAKAGDAGGRYFLRVGPDEVYAEPCSTKALFHASFALVNPESKTWQSKLDPMKADMEKALADLAGPPYKARAVSFRLPDFIDVVVNAGDSRNAVGATVGQSLPNFGPVANEGRGRTVAMTNFYTDPDSVASLREAASSLLCADAMKRYTDDKAPQLMSVVLHEAAHNLGPAHQYKVNGKIDRDVFGGPLASTLEELKAQTAALYFTDWLEAKKVITREASEQAHVRDVVWAFGHVSRGMYTDAGHPKNYSQLAAIQLGELRDKGAVAWRAGETAANGRDQGCLAIDHDKLRPAVVALAKTATGIKGRGDRAAAEALVAKHVDCKTGDAKSRALCKDLQGTVRERFLRAPKPSFVYEVGLGGR